MHNVYVVKKDGTHEKFDYKKIIIAIEKSAQRVIFSTEQIDFNKIYIRIESEIKNSKSSRISINIIHSIVENVLEEFYPAIAKSYRDYRNYKIDFVEILDKVYKKSQSIMYLGDKENSNSDSALVSTKRSLSFNQLNKELYKKFFLNTEELQAINEGYIYIHDMSARRDTMNCSLFDMASVLKNGFEMGNIFYNEPKTLDTAFDVIGDVTLGAASQQYGGFTIPSIDLLLAPYAKKSYQKYYYKYTKLGLSEDMANKTALQDVERDFEQGFQGWEYKFNTVASSRGDYPFITVTFGTGADEFSKMASTLILKTRKNGQGKDGFKKPVLFPKLVFLYDEKLHSEGAILEDVFNAGVECSRKTMYPDWLSLTGEGYVAEIYKKYGEIISPMGKAA